MWFGPTVERAIHKRRAWCCKHSSVLSWMLNSACQQCLTLTLYTWHDMTWHDTTSATRVQDDTVSTLAFKPQFRCCLSLVCVIVMTDNLNIFFPFLTAAPPLTCKSKCLLGEFGDFHRLDKMTNSAISLSPHSFQVSPTTAFTNRNVFFCIGVT